MQNIYSAQFESIDAHLFGDDINLRLKRNTTCGLPGVRVWVQGT